MKTLQSGPQLRALPWIVLLAALLAFLLATPPARAQVEGATAQAVPWASLSAEQQRLLGRFEANWDQLPPQRQQALARGSDRLLAMTPEQRERARERFARWRAMDDSQRRMVRDRWQLFERLTPDQQDAVRQGFKRFKSMSPERRRMLRETWRTASPDQRRRMLEVLRAERARRAGATGRPLPQPPPR